MKKPAWNLFNDLDEYWAEIVGTHNTAKEVNLMQNIGKSGRTLDLCCGTGRHSILLCEKGWDVIGLDISPNLLKKAKGTMMRRSIHFPVVRGDMRYLPFRNGIFLTIMNMFTSFGYLASESDDIRCLSEITRTLKKDGVFLLDVVNKEHLVAIFKSKDWGEFTNFYLLEERNLNHDGKMLYSKWTLLEKGGGKISIFEHRLRLYSLNDMKMMLNRVGLRIQEVYGGYEGEAYFSDSSRMIISACQY